MIPTLGTCATCTHPAAACHAGGVGQCRVVGCHCVKFESTIWPSKYRNRKTSCGFHLHDSAKESDRCCELRMLEKAGKIRFLTSQPEFELTVNGIRICKYRGDFKFTEDGQTVVEDVKGYRTRDYIIKRNLMRAVYGIVIRET